MNNRLGGGYKGDTETPEQKIPAQGFPGRDWETCMTINNTWGYKRDDHNWKSAGTLVRNLCDIASKGGNYLLNVGPDSTGIIPQPEVDRLEAIGKWMKVNGEAIYSTRPWKVYGEGPGKIEAGAYRARQSLKNLGASDIRFTRSKDGKVVYAIFLGWPEGEALIKSLGTASQPEPGKILHVEILGAAGKLKWKQTPDALRVELPSQPNPAGAYGAALKVSLA